MPQYIIKINWRSEPIQAEEEGDAINKFLTDIENTPQMTLSTFLVENIQIDQIETQKEYNEKFAKDMKKGTKSINI